jgi:hypothetical protein
MTRIELEIQDPILEREIQNYASRENLPLEEASIQMLRQAAGLETAKDSPIGNALDEFFGCWTEEEEAEFLKAIEPLGRIDEEMWD